MDSSPELNPDIDRGPALIAIYSVFCGVSLVFLVSRLYARHIIRGSGWDDVFMIITWVLFACLTALVGIMASNGSTRHVYYLDEKQAMYLVKLNYIGQPIGIVTVGTGKIAVGILISRLLGSLSKWRKRFVWGLLILTTIVTILAAIFTFTQCEVPAALWDPALRPTTYCWDPSVQSNFSIFSGSLNSAIDFILALIPITIIWRLQLSVRKRIGLGFLLGGGVLSGICASIKTQHLVSLAARFDLTWETFDLYIWTGSEIFLIIVCGSIPTVKPLWDRFSGMKMSTGKGSYLPSSHNSGGKYYSSPFRRDSNGIEIPVLDRSNGNSRTATMEGPRDDTSEWLREDTSSGIGLTSGQAKDVAIQVTRSFQVDWNTSPRV
ncbi:hypothetical protein F4775DRAFT_426977 [Biscogniauxia sp. FL1348]|nr:hypothetical protein F4775DRAFT_426977 [Biscogniauxia sp. FL1348]